MRSKGWRQLLEHKICKIKIYQRGISLEKEKKKVDFIGWNEKELMDFMIESISLCWGFIWEQY